MAYVVNPSNPSVELESQEALLAAKAVGITLHVLGASTEQELDAAFAKLASLHADGLVVAPEPFFDSQRERFVSLSARHAVPAIYGFRDYAVAGGLMSYGTSITDSLV
jgi:putative tryptophan/tyrosine transport system substrate-binding protein